MAADLDDLLDASGPPLTIRTVELTSELNCIISEAEGIVSDARRKTRRRLAAAGIAMSTVLGLGAGATAGGLIDLIPQPAGDSWLEGEGTVTKEFTLESGERCTVTYGIAPEEIQGLNKVGSGLTGSEWSATLDEAHAFMDSIDPASIDLAAAIAKFRTADSNVRDKLSQNGLSASEMSPALNPDETLTLAFGASLLERVQQHLRQSGYDPSVITIGSGNACRGLT